VAQDLPVKASTENQGGVRPSEPGKQPKGPEIGWNADVKKLVIPNTGLAGKVHGQPFVPDKVKVENGNLTMRRGTDFFADQEVNILLFLKEGEKLDGKTFEVASGSGFGSPHIQLHYKVAGENFPKVDMFMEKYAMKLEFGKESDDKLPGKIYLCTPDEAKSYVAGTFVAEVMTDPSSPPRPSDAPYVVGTIALKGKDKEKLQINAGYVGQTVKAETQSNSAGMEVVVGSLGGSVSSMTFQPRITTFGCDPKTGCRYKHVKMTPGLYLAYAQVAPAFLDWKWVAVKDKAQVSVDFSIDLADAGTLEVQLPAQSTATRISLIPLDADGKLPDFKRAWDHIAVDLGLNFEAKKGKTAIEKLRAGSYRVIAGKASADVKVKAGETVTAELPQEK
jgi:hypothetical protein